MAGTADLQPHQGGQVPDRNLSGHRAKPDYGPVEFFTVCLFVCLFFLTGSEVDSHSLPLFTDDNAGWPQDEFVSCSLAHLSGFFYPDTHDTCTVTLPCRTMKKETCMKLLPVNDPLSKSHSGKCSRMSTWVRKRHKTRAGNPGEVKPLTCCLKV